MNSKIFAEWFMKDFLPAVKHHEHVQNICSHKALVTDGQLLCSSLRAEEQ